MEVSKLTFLERLVLPFLRMDGCFPLNTEELSSHRTKADKLVYFRSHCGADLKPWLELVDTETHDKS